MAKWIKKVATTPLGLVGHIINSLSSNSENNAPSIKAVNNGINALAEPIGNLSGYDASHTLVDDVALLRTAEVSRYENISGAVVYDENYADGVTLIRDDHTLFLSAHLKNIPSGTQLTDVLTVPSYYINNDVAVTMTAWGTGTPTYRNAILKSSGKLEVKATFSSETTMQFKISATWIY